MLIWITSLWANPLARKCIIYAAAGLAIFWCIRLYGNAQWEKGISAGDERTQKRMEEQYRKQWAEAQNQIDGQKKLLEEGMAQNENSRKLLAAKEAELGRARQAITAALQRAIATAEANTAAGYQSARDVPDAQLVGAIRDLSGQLERDRTTARPPQ